MNPKQLSSFKNTVRQTVLKEFTVDKDNKPQYEPKNSVKYPHADAYWHGQHIDNEGSHSYADHVNNKHNDLDYEDNAHLEPKMKHLNDTIKKHHPDWSPADTYNHAKGARDNVKPTDGGYDKTFKETDKQLADAGSHPSVINAKNDMGDTFPLR